MNARAAIAGGLLLAACAGGAPVTTAFDRSAGEVEVRLHGDGFVTSAGRRMPLERFVLELRQRVRSMDQDDVRGRFVVRVRL
ncbi:MAG TPA: hypothetical protein ENI87_12245, partial [bacterium]|nr:hypothetical protein [bacterium]